MHPEKEIVIADSDPEIRELLDKMLQDSPLRLKVIDGPSQLPELLSGDNSSISCILVDVRRDLNGIRVANSLRESLNGHIPLVFITTQTTDEYPEMEKLAEIVPQPFGKKDIVNAVSRAFERKNGKV